MTGFRQQLERIVADCGISAEYEISYKSVFGAVAAYANGKIFLTNGKFGLAAKLAYETCQGLMAEGVGAPLKYFEKGHVKRNYVVLSADLLKDEERRNELVKLSAAFVQDNDKTP
ncbi:MAG: TfoX/Sxy family protein [Alphaproteobacteria bacterium]|jgi:TfoX/Sxy family transcriptional regulator of competence genes|nr:TfoX/Sxy family protein [Alphaproteobacteria bacterium]